MLMIPIIIAYVGINCLIAYLYLFDKTDPDIKQLHVPESHLLLLFYFFSFILVFFPKRVTEYRKCVHYKQEYKDLGFEILSYDYLKINNRHLHKKQLAISRYLKMRDIKKKIKRKKLWRLITLK